LLLLLLLLLVVVLLVVLLLLLLPLRMLKASTRVKSPPTCFLSLLRRRLTLCLR
jgi:hypothetical protein